MEEKELKAKDIPWGYALCFNDACGLKDKCMHYQARLLKAEGRYSGQAVYPTAWQDGECRCFREKKLVKKAWGFSQLYKNVPHYQRAEARHCVRSYFSSGNGPYYRFYHGENKLSPQHLATAINFSLSRIMICLPLVRIIPSAANSFRHLCRENFWMANDSAIS